MQSGWVKERKREGERERVTSCCQARTHDVTLRLPSINWRQFGGKRQHGGLYTSMSIKPAALPQTQDPRLETGDWRAKTEDRRAKKSEAAADLCNLPAADSESESEMESNSKVELCRAAGPLPSVTVAQKKKKNNKPYFLDSGPR